LVRGAALVNVTDRTSSSALFILATVCTLEVCMSKMYAGLMSGCRDGGREGGREGFE
jgi:hypothetical protein